MMNINTSHIRFLEKEFPTYIKPKKNRNGKRMFTAPDIEMLKQIQYLTKDKGMTLVGAKKMLNSNKKEINKQVNLVETLENIKSFLHELKVDLNNQPNGSE